MKKNILIATTLALAGLPGLWANTAPTVVIQSATMRPGTTFMDIVFRVNDPDDATVKTRALAFKDGVRSFANVIKPTAFVEGTGSKIGDAIPANANHTITWDVAADWDVQLGQVKFEVLAMDGRGLLPFEWITIPAAGGKPALTISKDSTTDTEVLNALFWKYADGDNRLNLIGGNLRGTTESGIFSNVDLATGSTLGPYASPFILKIMNLDPVDSLTMNYAVNTARTSILNNSGWHASNNKYDGLQTLFGWGSNKSGEISIPTGLDGISQISSGGAYYDTSGFSLALKSDGTVVGWGSTSVPQGLKDVVSIAAGGYHSLAIKNDGSVVAWGSNSQGQTTIPYGLSGVVAVAAGTYHSVALKSDGTVVAWGYNDVGQASGPAELSEVKSIVAGRSYSLALKSNGTLFGWGAISYLPPSGLSDVIAISGGPFHILALRRNGTVVAWGSSSAKAAVPDGLSGVTAIAAGDNHSLALKSDGTVVAWGGNSYGQTTIPDGLSGVTTITAGYAHSLALRSKRP
jgi:hypothetical protein